MRRYPIIPNTQGHRQRMKVPKATPLHILGVSPATLLTATLRPWCVRVGATGGGAGLERQGKGSCEPPRRGKEGDRASVWGGDWTTSPPKSLATPETFPTTHKHLQLTKLCSHDNSPLLRCFTFLDVRSISSLLLLTAIQELEFPFCRWRKQGPERRSPFPFQLRSGSLSSPPPGLPHE